MGREFIQDFICADCIALRMLIFIHRNMMFALTALIHNSHNPQICDSMLYFSNVPDIFILLFYFYYLRARLIHKAHFACLKFVPLSENRHVYSSASYESTQAIQKKSQ